MPVQPGNIWAQEGRTHVKISVERKGSSDKHMLFQHSLHAAQPAAIFSRSLV